MHHPRIRLDSLHEKIMSAAQAAEFVQDGMTLGISGFGGAGDAKAVPLALIERAKQHPFKINLITGASLGRGLDGMMAQAGLLARRMPFQGDPVLRKAINDGRVVFIDQHLSEVVEQLRAGSLPTPDIAVIEAVAITEQGYIVPTSSVGNSASFAQTAKQVIVELNLASSPHFEGMHDIYLPHNRPDRGPIPIINPNDRIGTQAIEIDPSKIVAIVICETPESAVPMLLPDHETQAIADHLVVFFEEEVEKGRLGRSLAPLQVGVGSIANAVMCGLIDAPFSDLVQYSEVLQDSTFDLLDAGKLTFASGCSITLSEKCGQRVFGNLEKYADRLVLRPQEISNNPEVIRRLGVIAINTALEFDLYGNVNSTHVGGTHMMNGIGGSGDFARNALLSIFVTKSIAKEGAISRVVPMVSHVDHTEHDVDILVTEQGLADLRGLAPRERALLIINNCVHPDYREALDRYFTAACAKGGHTPHVLRDALSWHINLQETGSMLVAASGAL
ncbi:MAG TPA: acetyl-CoA hydrolase/transferase family protein [Pseudomonas sp.]|uniref:acetyl-CoA hydrolase/transferase family protein n=1 Tax=Pseudomonas sp. TaxID=306 RepID=UPI002ED8AE73